MTRVLHTWQEQAAPERTALVMVDLQNDFVDPDGNPILVDQHV